MRILTVIGARPQFIKAAVVSRAIQEFNTSSSRGEIKEIICHTGQHYDVNMSDVFFEEMNIPIPNYFLGIGGGSHGAMTGQQLEKIEEVLIIEKPDLVLVYGDTNSTLAGALAAVKLHIPIAHIEAGLRSFNREMPEEINRILTDHMSELLFLPSITSQYNLEKEGINVDKMHVVGDVMYDAAKMYSKDARKPEWFDSLISRGDEYVLCTIHRADNTENPDRLRSIFRGLNRSDFPVILPIHPRTKSRIKAMDLEFGDNIHIVDPVGYLEMVWLEVNSHLISTDSGGIQKEAFFHGKPCITLRDDTEWVELVSLGASRLVGADENKIANEINSKDWFFKDSELYGDGSAAKLIVSIIVDKITQPR